MKKSLFITVLCVLCGLVACNKEQQPEVTPDVPETPPHPIVGEWRLMNIINNKDTLILENCARKSSLLLNEMERSLVPSTKKQKMTASLYLKRLLIRLLPTRSCCKQTLIPKIMTIPL